MDPATISLIASLLSQSIPAALGALAKPVSPEQRMRDIMAMLRRETMGSRQAFLGQATQAGQAAAQNFMAGAGASGLGATGMGAAAESIALSMPNSIASRANVDYDTNLTQMAMNGMASGQFNWQPDPLTRFLGAAAPVMAGGKNPFEAPIDTLLQRFLGGGTEATTGLKAPSSEKPRAERDPAFGPAQLTQRYTPNRYAYFTAPKSRRDLTLTTQGWGRVY